jgi:hypothetical protein
MDDNTENLFAAIAALIAESKQHAFANNVLTDRRYPPPFTPQDAANALTWLTSFVAIYKRLAHDGKWPGVSYDDDRPPHST